MTTADARWNRFSLVVLILAVVAAPLVAFGAVKALKSTSNDPRQWLPQEFAETDTYDWFQQHFGSDEFAVVSWPGCTLEDPRVSRMADALAQSPQFDRVLTGRSVVSELMGPPLRMSRAAAMARLRGILVHPEQETSCLILSTSAVGRADRIGAVATIERQAALVGELTREELKLAGPTVDAAAIDTESRRLLFGLAGFSALISFCAAAFRLGSVRLAIIVLTVAVYSTGLSLALLYFSGGKMNLLMTMLPPLIYVLSISSAVHLANYYRDARSGTANPLRVAISHGWLPCSLAAGTTAIGLVSLYMSKIEPIRMFGVFSALGVIVSVGVLFSLLPAALHLFPPKLQSTDGGTAPRGEIGQRMVRLIGRRHQLLMWGCLVLMAICASQLPTMKSTVKLQDRFLRGSDEIADYRWLEENIGPMVPLEVVIHFDQGDPRGVVEQLWVIAAIQAKIQSLDEPVATMSAVNFCPPLPRGESVGAVIQRKIISSPRTRQRLTEAKFLTDQSDQRLWRITVRAHAIGDLDYGLFAEKLRAAVAPLISEQHVQATFTGVIPLIYKAQRQLLQDLVRSFLAAFMVIGVVLMLVLRGVSAALLAMIPNLFPAVVVFGGISWLGIPVQIGSVMTASAALGIAVDDTVHFLTWFRRGLAAGQTRMAALEDAYDRCAGAMTHTTLICSSGLLVFAASSFVPILHFAWLMVFLLLAALVGDLVLLPAILAGRLGKRFEPSKSPSHREEPADVA